LKPRDLALESQLSQLHKPAGAGVKVWWRRWGGLLIGAVVLAALSMLVWKLLSDTASTKREVATPPMLMLPPPPPPPPEPEKLPEPPPEKVTPEVVEPKLSPVEAPQDDNTPSPSKDLGDPVTIDGAAQAGTDSFGIAAGRGGGMSGTGGGLGSGSFANYLSASLQQAYVRDPRTRLLAMDVNLNLWLDADGKTVRVELTRSTGDSKTDEAVLAMVRDFRTDAKKPADMPWPIRISLKGRRP